MGRNRILNKFNIDGDDVFFIPTNSDTPFIISLSNLPLISSYSWYLSKGGYIESRVFVNGKRSRIFLHRLLLGVHGLNWKDSIVDHINGNKLDNRFSNLRVCSNSENQLNHRNLRRNNTSDATGIVFDKRWGGFWVARISVSGKNIYLGSFHDKNDAIIARKRAEFKYYDCGKWLNPELAV